VGFKKVERRHENPGHRLYQLFHGKWWQRAFWAYLLPWHLVRADLMTSTSPDHAKHGELDYGVNAENSVITGFPRNDALFSTGETTIDPQIRSLADEANERDLPIFAYLPTFRDDNSHFEFPLRELEEMATRIGVILAIKLHFVDSLRAKSYLAKPDGNLRLVDPQIDAKQIFPVAAGLISDYSSVVYDYMLTEKPVIYFVPDLDEYLQHSRNFCYVFDEVTPGPKARTLRELEDAIVAARDDNQEEWREQYESVLELFHTYRDSRSGQRVYEAIFTRCVLNSE
jgi:CDP-glycerol glycerophosphotransferase